MEKNLTISIEQGNSRADIVVNHTNGTSVRKNISIQELKKAMDAVYADHLKGNMLGPIPEGYLESCYSSPGNFRIWITLPAKIRTLMYYGQVCQIPFPSLLFYFEVIKTNISKSCLYAFHGKAAEGIPLYRYPFGNVYENGNICWGNTQLPRILSLKDVEHLTEMFFMSDTNDDLFQSICHRTQRELLYSLKGDFPLSKLQKTGTVLLFQ